MNTDALAMHTGVKMSILEVVKDDAGPSTSLANVVNVAIILE